MSRSISWNKDTASYIQLIIVLHYIYNIKYMSSLEGWNSNPKPNHIFNPIPKLKPKLLRSNDIEKMYFGAFHEIKLRTRFSYYNNMVRYS